MSLEGLLNWPPPDRLLGRNQSPDASSSGSVFLITDTLQRSGSFLLHRFVARHLRLPAWAVTLVCISQQPAHYAAVHKKLGMHLSLHQKKHTFQAIDVFSRLADTVEPAPPRSSAAGSDAQADAQAQASDPVETLFEQIAASVASQLESVQSEDPDAAVKPCIVIDDLSMLLYAGMSPTQLVKLTMALCDLVIQRDGCLVVLAHDDCPDDQELVALNMWLARLSHVLLHVRPLESGVTDSVHGQLTVAIGPQSQWAADDSSSRSSRGVSAGTLLYRIADASVDWFALGSTRL
ncbi:hypothetical protein BC831DRAFT_475446 [Entophlyctis helioformis]|nr:hypothetical protein BC831DRAFT_475446 [Entophlyctis helioformis]